MISLSAIQFISIEIKQKSNYCHLNFAWYQNENLIF